MSESMISLGPPPRVAITGRPRTIASISTMPKGSATRVVWQTTSQAPINRATSLRKP